MRRRCLLTGGVEYLGELFSGVQIMRSSVYCHVDW